MKYWYSRTDINISQDSTPKHLRHGGILNNHYFKFNAECAGERILNIGQYLMQL